MLVKKNSSWRFCIDYRRLNALTRQDTYPLPKINESLDTLAVAIIFPVRSFHWTMRSTKDWFLELESFAFWGHFSTSHIAEVIGADLQGTQLENTTPEPVGLPVPKSQNP